MSEIYLEMYEEKWQRKSDIEGALEKGDVPFDSRRGLHKELSDIEKMLGIRNDEFEDDLIAKWEKELAEGKDPDLTEGLNSAK